MEVVRAPRRHAEYLRQFVEWAAAYPDAAAERLLRIQREEAEAVAREEVERLAEAARAVDGRLQASGIPARLLDAAAGPLDETAALAAARAFGGRGTLLLAGPSGGGKSVAAAWLLREFAAQSRGTPLFRRAAELARLGLYGPEAWAQWRDVQTCRLLVLDDLGAEVASEVWRAAFDELFDARHSERRTTVITTNLEPEAFKVRYGERITDRIREDGRVVVCDKKSMRRPA